jgi:hypothetical protein
MAIKIGTPKPPRRPDFSALDVYGRTTLNAWDLPLMRRVVTIADKDGVEHVITCKEDLQQILAQMTPQELETFKAQYRFSWIHNLTNNKNYVGTNRDIS